MSIDGDFLIIHNANNYSEEELNDIRKKADDYYSNDIFSKAIDLYKIIYDSYGDDTNPWVLYYIGFCYLKLDDRNNAIKYYRKAVEIAEEDNDEDLLYILYEKLTNSSFITKDYMDALNYSKLLLKYSSPSERAHCLNYIADAYYWKNDFENALSYFDAAISDFKKNENNKEVLKYAYDYINSLMKKGDILIQRKHYQEALDVLNECKKRLKLYHEIIGDIAFENLEIILNSDIKKSHAGMAGLLD